MPQYIGVDVYNGTGAIDWDTLQPCIDFAMIKAGQGQTMVDARLDYNAQACQRLGIPFGVYWYINATTVADASLEADKCLQTIAPYSISFPVAYDFESSNPPANQVVVDMARTFLDKILNAGYIPALYANPDFISRFYQPIINNEIAQGLYELWVARYYNNDWQYTYPLLPNHTTPGIECGMWQWGYWYSIPGINNATNRADANISYKDYSHIIPPRPPYPTAIRKMPLWMMLKNN